MKMPRTIRIVRLMLKIGSSMLHNESLLLQGSLIELDNLGGVYIKFLQIIVISMDLQSQGNYRELLAVYDGSLPDELDIQRYLRSLGPTYLDKFASVESQPLATGSFGQVYRATLLSGERVIIKVLRPSVIRYLRYDLRLLKLLAWAYGLADTQKMIDFRAIYRELRRTSLQETDYLYEAEAATHYYKAYLNHPRLVIPKTYLELSSERVIVQEHIEGLALTTLLQQTIENRQSAAYVKEQTGSDLFTQMYTIGFELLTRAATGKLVQADPHPGNIILLRDNRVALIDFGMMTELKQNRTAFYEMLLQYNAMYSDNLSVEDFALAALKYLSPKLYAALLEADKLLGIRGSAGTHRVLLDKLRQATAELSQDEYTAPLVSRFLQQRQIMKVLFFALNKGNRFGFSFDLGSVTLLKAAQGYLNLMRKLDQDAVVVAQVIRDSVAFAQANLDQVIDSKSQTMHPDEAMEILSVWFDKMARNDPQMVYRLIGSYP